LVNRPYSAPTWLEAQHAFEQALEIDPGSVEARIGLARVLAGKLARDGAARLSKTRCAQSGCCGK